MKKLILFLTIIFSFKLSAQEQTIAGTYAIKSISDDGKIEWVLNLNLDKTFTFYFNRALKSHKKAELCIGKPDPRNHQAAKGTWTTKKNYVYFHTQESDLDSTFNLDFNNYKAVYKSKHPRDQSDRVIIPHLIFLEDGRFPLKQFKFDKK